MYIIDLVKILVILLIKHVENFGRKVKIIGNGIFTEKQLEDHVSIFHIINASSYIKRSKSKFNAIDAN